MGLKRINWVCSELIKKGRNKKENIAIIQIENQEALNNLTLTKKSKDFVLFTILVFFD